MLRDLVRTYDDREDDAILSSRRLQLGSIGIQCTGDFDLLKDPSNVPQDLPEMMSISSKNIVYQSDDYRVSFLLPDGKIPLNIQFA
jgi:hypothetical protein